MFKHSFKYYKSKNPPPNFEEVLDFQKPEFELNGIVIYKDLALKSSLCNYGLKNLKDWRVYQIPSKNGFIFIRNPFTHAGQRYWIKKCLKDYSRKPNKLNIDNFNVIPSDKNWWDTAQSDKTLLQSLRWATLGYHHNWDTKIYSEDNRSDFPSDLKDMTEYIARKLGFMDFIAEAAIVNYYQLNSTLSGHTDHSEQNLEAPLFSFSFGQTAVFLLGGKTIDEKPVAMFLRSGDILIMSKQSRLCYHGVPRVIKIDHDIWNDEDEFNSNNYYEANDALWTPFNNYLSHSRINMNVRQVLHTGQLKLCH
ncbi:unnamed protein product [Psylliodes chrysocephalus]|uniref:Fe2OG dioxygenase domain-containing protein n=1 Tax=Psylliodes chrysocephalus TaxID=3402493 RepID=A0A9P0D8B4_9CUCU|nr:unnamed protein product [Psylliodes chrysocephala]